MKELYRKIFERFNTKETPEDMLVKNINSALKEIYCARTNFDMATGSDNIELAIYELSTAEIKYQNLIKEAKRLGILRKDFPGCVKVEEVEENQCG